MSSIARGRHLGAAAFAVAGAFALTACQSPPKPIPPGPVVAAPPSLALPATVLQAAAVYSDYVDKATAMSADFGGGSSVEAGLTVGAAYEPRQFQRGEAAYGALIALQDPGFLAGVREFTPNPEQRDQIATAIFADPNYVLGLKGADTAANLVAAVLTDQGAKLFAAGQRVKQAAYDVQHQAWSKDTVADRDGRLAQAKSLSSAQGMASIDTTGRLSLASTGAQPISVPAAAPPANTPYSPLVVRSLAVAALAVLGRGGDQNADSLLAVLDEPNQTNCLSLGKLNLYQCLAVSKPYYEDVFCLGQHVLMDTGQCIQKGAGVKFVYTPPPPRAEPPVKAKKSKGKAKGKSKGKAKSAKKG